MFGSGYSDYVFFLAKCFIFSDMETGLANLVYMFQFPCVGLVSQLFKVGTDAP